MDSLSSLLKICDKFWSCSVCAAAHTHDMYTQHKVTAGHEQDLLHALYSDKSRLMDVCSLRTFCVPPDSEEKEDSMTSLLHCKLTARSRSWDLVLCCLQSIIHQSILPFVGDCRHDCCALVFSYFYSAACVHVCWCVAASIQAISINTSCICSSLPSVWSLGCID